MSKIQKTMSDLLVDDSGASAVEYGLLVAGIAAVIVIIVFSIGTMAQAAFLRVCTAMANGGVGGNCNS
jgi:pilus assembly protein Flp/PilA